MKQEYTPVRCEIIDLRLEAAIMSGESDKDYNKDHDLGDI